MTTKQILAETKFDSFKMQLVRYNNQYSVERIFNDGTKVIVETPDYEFRTNLEEYTETIKMYLESLYLFNIEDESK